MNYRGVLYLLGRLLIALAVALIAPAAVSYWLHSGEVHAFLVPAALAAVMPAAKASSSRWRSGRLAPHGSVGSGSRARPRLPGRQHGRYST